MFYDLRHRNINYNAPGVPSVGAARGKRKSKTLGWRRITKRGLIYVYPTDIIRPKTRADCKDGTRPCPWVSCEYNLYLDITPHHGIMLNFPNIEPHQMQESCALDVAARGQHLLSTVARLMNIDEKRIRVIEKKAMCAMKKNSKVQKLAKERGIGDNGNGDNGA